MYLRRSLAAIFLLMCGACSSSSTAPSDDQGVVDTGADASADINMSLDVGMDSGADIQDTTEDAWEAPPTKEASDLVTLPATDWMVATIFDSSNDTVLDRLVYDLFEFPETAGADEYGVVWSEATANENGGLGSFANGNALVYLATRINVEADTRVVARIDNGFTVFVNGARQPADIYGSGKARFPILLKSGDNVLVIRGRGGRSVSAFFQSTEDELYFNPSDKTRPDLRVGTNSAEYFGIPLVNLSEDAVLDIRAKVVENEYFEASEMNFLSLAPKASTQLGFHLRPKATWEAADTEVPITLRIESPNLEWSYEHETSITTIAADAAYRQTFLSPVDGSIQYYGVRPPTDFDPESEYALVLSLHGASVEAINQAKSYSPKDWAIIIAPTNRRPFGFDWEEWGHLNGLAALNDATERFIINPERVYVTGHSMGGHGTWQFGVHHPGRFAVVAPSAGWNSFYTYGGASKPGGPFARSRAHSDTTEYITNIKNRGIYIIHGDADDNVPFSEGQNMYNTVSQINDDVEFHVEPGAGHWWDGPAAAGADCVDWPPLFEFMFERTLDPHELDFNFISSAPWYTNEHSYVKILSAESPMSDCELTSSYVEGTLSLEALNIRTMEIDGAVLRAKGIDALVLNQQQYTLPDGPLVIGPETGKGPQVSGPYNQIYQRPFCFVYPDSRPKFKSHVSYLVSDWYLIGNGHAVAIPYSALTDEIRATYNMIYVGMSPEQAKATDLPMTWSGSGVEFNGKNYAAAGLLSVYPEGKGLSAVLTTSPGMEHLLYYVVPFSSRSGMPDYLIWAENGLVAAGFYTNEWTFDSSLGIVSQ